MLVGSVDKYQNHTKRFFMLRLATPSSHHRLFLSTSIYYLLIVSPYCMTRSAVVRVHDPSHGRHVAITVQQLPSIVAFPPPPSTPFTPPTPSFDRLRPRRRPPPPDLLLPSVMAVVTVAPPRDNPNTPNKAGRATRCEVELCSTRCAEGFSLLEHILLYL
jgi:hypothetical protein